MEFHDEILVLMLEREPIVDSTTAEYLFHNLGPITLRVRDNLNCDPTSERVGGKIQYEFPR